MRDFFHMSNRVETKIEFLNRYITFNLYIKKSTNQANSYCAAKGPFVLYIKITNMYKKKYPPFSILIFFMIYSFYNASKGP